MRIPISRAIADPARSRRERGAGVVLHALRNSALPMRQLESTLNTSDAPLAAAIVVNLPEGPVLVCAVFLS